MSDDAKDAGQAGRAGQAGQAGVAVVRVLLDRTFSAHTGDGLRALIDSRTAGQHLADFKLNPVVYLSAAAGGMTDTPRPRFALSDSNEAAAWAERVRQRWPDRAVGAFLALAPAGTRRMIDTDGARAVLYLDDLQDAGAAPLRAPVPQLAGPLMCATLDLPSGDRGWITRHPAPPTRAQLVAAPPSSAASSDPGTRRDAGTVLGAGIQRLSKAGVGDLAAAGSGGLWGMRWDHRGGLRGVLWVSEARWRGTVAPTQALLRRLASPDHPAATAWGRCARALQPLGWQLYPDAIELRPSGAMAVTLGLLPTRLA